MPAPQAHILAMVMWLKNQSWFCDLDRVTIQVAVGDTDFLVDRVKVAVRKLRQIVGKLGVSIHIRCLLKFILNFVNLVLSIFVRNK